MNVKKAICVILLILVVSYCAPGIFMFLLKASAVLTALGMILLAYFIYKLYKFMDR